MMDTALQNAMTTVQMAPVAAPQKSASYQAAHKAAVQFEGTFISQFLSQMFKGVSTDGPFGGGPGEKMFRSLMMDQYAKEMAQRGGFGLSDALTRALLSHQEVAS